MSPNLGETGFYVHFTIAALEKETYTKRNTESVIADFLLKMLNAWLSLPSIHGDNNLKKAPD